MTVSNSGGVPIVTYRCSWDKPKGCPRCAGRRAVQKHGKALERLAQ